MVLHFLLPHFSVLYFLFVKFGPSFSALHLLPSDHSWSAIFWSCIFSHPYLFVYTDIIVSQDRARHATAWIRTTNT